MTKYDDLVDYLGETFKIKPIVAVAIADRIVHGILELTDEFGVTAGEYPDDEHDSGWSDYESAEAQKDTYARLWPDGQWGVAHRYVGPWEFSTGGLDIVAVEDVS